MPAKTQAVTKTAGGVAGPLLLAAILALPAGAFAAPRTDRDRDGLSDRMERRIGTNVRRSDSDRDRLKDGREVKLRTNPLRADTDGDGIRDDREVRRRSNPRSADTDADGIEDRFEYGLDGRASEVKGTLSEIGADSVTITRRDGTERTVRVTSATRLRTFDADGDGRATLADFQPGDRVEAHVQASDSGPVALSLKNESSRGDDDHGDGDDDQDGSVETKGVISSLDADSVTIALRDGRQETVQVTPSTYLRGPDRDGDGSSTVADLRVGDRVEARTAAGSAVALSLKVEIGSHEDDDDEYEVKGRVAALSGGSVTITRRDGGEITMVIGPTTRLRVADRDGDGQLSLADFRIGDRVEAEAPVGSLLATKLKLDN